MSLRQLVGKILRIGYGPRATSCIGMMQGVGAARTGHQRVKGNGAHLSKYYFVTHFLLHIQNGHFQRHLPTKIPYAPHVSILVSWVIVNTLLLYTGIN